MSFMEKINLRNDYCAIAHNEILEALIKHSDNSYVGYGYDEETATAVDLIKKEINNPNAGVFFLPGGTLTNKVLISHVLKPYEAVISCETGHINVHETGTIEQSGHKILVAPSIEGKIKANDIEKICLSHGDEHMVKPKMVYISNPTELGTIYKKDELIEISNVCKKYDLYLYVDGARLATALTSKINDLDFETFSSLVDSFYIGGTKNGLILGEALVVNNEKLIVEIKYSIKHFGGMYCKGFVNGIQFKTLFKDQLFYRIGKLQNDLAEYLYNELLSIGIDFLYKQETNQIFPVLSNEVIKKLSEKLSFEMWEKGKEQSVIRFVTHYKLTKEDINNVVNIIKEAINGL